MGWSVKVAADWMAAMAAGSSAVATDPVRNKGQYRKSVQNQWSGFRHDDLRRVWVWSGCGNWERISNAAS